MRFLGALLGATCLSAASASLAAVPEAPADPQVFGLGQIVVPAPKAGRAPVPGVHLLRSLDVASDRWTVISTGLRYYRTGAYTQAGLRIDYAVTDKVEIGVGAHNLFDDTYQLADGFPEPGRSYFASVRARY
ncbi:MAG TPA: hypothetical protein VL460_05785 [Caulobacteraceae bacterium]|jgi:iron complex outermembrane receptor protein|nr:hypothetical protein [Caulobacteraceae bacterium]